MEVTDKRWNIIAENYHEERDQDSLPALLIDNFVINYFSKNNFNTILDYGAGTGTLTHRLASMGHDMVAFEPCLPMLEKLKDRNKDNSFKIISDIKQASSFDSILCINVVDHIEHIKPFFDNLAKHLNENGKLLLSIPHPLKDLGEWRKETIDGTIRYIDFRIDGYFKEGVCFKNRENKKGIIIAESVPSYHRTLSTYYNALSLSGFTITALYEPHVLNHEHNSVLHEKASRIPYFLLFDCTKN